MQKYVHSRMFVCSDINMPLCFLFYAFQHLPNILDLFVKNLLNAYNIWRLSHKFLIMLSTKRGLSSLTFESDYDVKKYYGRATLVPVGKLNSTDLMMSSTF